MHGGDIYNNRIDIDHSVNLNPIRHPDMDRSLEDALREGARKSGYYPDISQKALRTAISEADEADADCVIAGCGASELLMAAVAMILPRKALLIEPCYTGYA